MKEETRKRLRRARRFLAMANERFDVDLPEVVAHTAYYAMYHAATAVLVENNVPVPKTHSGIITRLSQLDREQSMGARTEDARLSRRLERRLIADYDTEDILTVEHA